MLIARAYGRVRSFWYAELRGFHQLSFLKVERSAAIVSRNQSTLQDILKGIGKKDNQGTTSNSPGDGSGNGKAKGSQQQKQHSNRAPPQPSLARSMQEQYMKTDKAKRSKTLTQHFFPETGRSTDAGPKNNNNFNKKKQSNRPVNTQDPLRKNHMNEKRRSSAEVWQQMEADTRPGGGPGTRENNRQENAGSPRHKQQQQRIKRDRQNFQQQKGIDTTGEPIADNRLHYHNHRAKAPVKATGAPINAENVSSSDQAISIAELKQMAQQRLKENEHSQGRDNAHGGKKKEATKVKGDAEASRVVHIPASGLTLRELASRLSMKLAEVRSKLDEMGELDEAGDDMFVEADVAELAVLEMGLDAVRVSEKKTGLEQKLNKPSAHADESAVELKPRAPVVCVMGHVDHGKTTLLDALRKSSVHVAGTEAGGITQKLSAFTVELTGSRRALFLDTPGHAAFSAMRSHGAVATDVVVLVVAMDDGVRPQTIEVLKMAQEAGTSVIVALNKMDKIPPHERSNARTRVLNQLLEYNLIAEEYGGDVQVVEVAGKTGQGLDVLIESILVQADYLELKAAAEGQAEAIVLDVNMEKGRGVVADVLVKWGSLKVGDPIVVGNTFGKVKSLIDDSGKSVTAAGPSSSVRMMGLRSLPMTGQELLSVGSENDARDISERRQRVADLRRQREEELFQIRQAQRKAQENSGGGADATAAGDGHAVLDVKPVVHVVVKADGVCTLEALHRIVEGISARAVAVEVDIVHASVGNITRNDVELAASGPHALILAFNVNVADMDTRSAAKQLDVSIRSNDVIYRLEEDLIDSMTSLLPKDKVLEVEGSARVQQVFHLKKGKNSGGPTTVAGLVVESGRMRNSGGSHSHHHSHGSNFVFRVLRNGVPVLEESQGQSHLKRFKDTVHEEGDQVECCRVAWKTLTEVLSPEPSEGRSDARMPSWLTAENGKGESGGEGKTSILQRAHTLGVGQHNYA